MQNSKAPHLPRSRRTDKSTIQNLKLRIGKDLLNLIFPIKCLGCGREGQFICPDCLGKIPLRRESFSGANGSQGLNGLIITSYYDYPLLKKAVLRYKYDFIKDLAEPLSRLMIKKLRRSAMPFSLKNSLLVPVPLHPRRLRWRGFNQSELLAQNLGREFNLALMNDLLMRVKNTEPQMGLANASQRNQNMKNAFRLCPENKAEIKHKNIILVDDITTTGATLSECAYALKPLRPESVWGLVLAQG